MKIVLKVGGSVVASPINSDKVNEYAKLAAKLQRAGHRVAVVVGGGSTARAYIFRAHQHGQSLEVQDRLGIGITRIVAEMLLKRLGCLGGNSPALTVEEAVKTVRRGKIAVVGGLKPGMTTDTVAALIAEQMRADIMIKATSVDGVYDRDPSEPNAVLMRYLYFDELLNMLPQNLHTAGEHPVLDLAAARILAKNKTKTVVVNGFKTKNVIAALNCKEVGTTITARSTRAKNFLTMNRITLPNGLIAVMHPIDGRSVAHVLRACEEYVKYHQIEHNDLPLEPDLGCRYVLKVNVDGVPVYLVLMGVIGCHVTIKERIKKRGFPALFKMVRWCFINGNLYYYTDPRYKQVTEALVQKVNPNIHFLLQNQKGGRTDG
jgi:uridylate kinase